MFFPYKIVKKGFKYIENYLFCRKKITILSNNCIATFLYKFFGSKYYTPTVNLQIVPRDFVKFLRNLDYYLSSDLVEVNNPDVESFKEVGGGDINFPVGQIGDIQIYFQHYENFEFARQKWNERKQRINHNYTKNNGGGCL